jgi:hypothetical protein
MTEPLKLSDYLKTCNDREYAEYIISTMYGNCPTEWDEAKKAAIEAICSRSVITLLEGASPESNSCDTCEENTPLCNDVCRKWLKEHDAAIAQAAHNEGRNEALSDLYRKMITPVNSSSWDDKTYTDGEWVDAIEDLRQPEQKKEVPE